MPTNNKNNVEVIPLSDPITGPQMSPKSEQSDAHNKQSAPRKAKPSSTKNNKTAADILSNLLKPVKYPSNSQASSIEFHYHKPDPPPIGSLGPKEERAWKECEARAARKVADSEEVKLMFRTRMRDMVQARGIIENRALSQKAPFTLETGQPAEFSADDVLHTLGDCNCHNYDKIPLTIPNKDLEAKVLHMLTSEHRLNTWKALGDIAVRFFDAYKPRQVSSNLPKLTRSEGQWAACILHWLSRFPQVFYQLTVHFGCLYLSDDETYALYRLGKRMRRLYWEALVMFLPCKDNACCSLSSSYDLELCSNLIKAAYDILQLYVEYTRSKDPAICSLLSYYYDCFALQNKDLSGLQAPPTIDLPVFERSSVNLGKVFKQIDIKRSRPHELKGPGKRAKTSQEQ